MLTRTRDFDKGGQAFGRVSSVPRPAPRNLLAPAVLPISIGFLMFGATGSNALLATGAVVVLLIGSTLLWRPSESPILLFAFAFQWLQISAGIFYAGWLDMTMNELSEIHGDMHKAAILSLIGLLALSCGMRLGAGAIRPSDGQLAKATALRYPTRDWFRVYVAAGVISALCHSLAWKIPGLTQPLLAVADLKWAFFLILTYAAFSSREGIRTYWLVAFAFELISSLGGYFSDFKTVFFFTIFGLAAAQVRFALRTYVGLAILGMMLLTMAIIWSAIKVDYRDYVSGGQRTQVVTVDFGDQLGKLAELASNVNGATMEKGADLLIRRVAYLEFFAAAIDYVPGAIPFQEGAIWRDAILRPFMPRFLFPDKTTINDSQRTNKYTGLSVSGSETGTSISIGYMGETYIDFGPYGMMAALLAFGYFLGSIYKYMLTAPESRGLLGMGLASAIIQVAAPFEASITKMFGGLIVMLLVSWLVIKVVIPNFAPWMRE